MTTHSETLVLIKSSTAEDSDFVCPNCEAFVARLKGVEVADPTDPETYALANVIRNRNKPFLGVPINHHGRLGDDNHYCRRRFFFWDIGQGLVRVTPVVKIVRAYAAA